MLIFILFIPSLLFFNKIYFFNFFCPIYLSSLYLGYFEDKINEKLNELINTRIYTDKSCLVSRESFNKFANDKKYLILVQYV